MARYDEIFAIQSDAEFEREALRLFKHQAEHCVPYAEYIRLLGIEPSEIHRVEDIPMMPIEIFKSHKVYCGEREPQMIFTSSATTGMVQSRHYVADLALYERSFMEAFRQFYGNPKECSIYALLPSYLEREGSSLVYMAEKLIQASSGGGFYLNDYDKLVQDMSRDDNPKILLGVTYALLDLAENYAPHFEDTVVMETGGMKGRRKELPKSELHKILCSAFGVERIHSEYGMAELMSQAYSFGDGIFRTPKWMRVLIRDINNPFARLAAGRRGGLDIIDLANRDSCAFIATQDMGLRYDDDSFRIEGRISQSDIRGCNLLVQ